MGTPITVTKNIRLHKNTTSTAVSKPPLQMAKRKNKHNSEAESRNSLDNLETGRSHLENRRSSCPRTNWDWEPPGRGSSPDSAKFGTTPEPVLKQTLAKTTEPILYPVVRSNILIARNTGTLNKVSISTRLKFLLVDLEDSVCNCLFLFYTFLGTILWPDACLQCHPSKFWWVPHQLNEELQSVAWNLRLRVFSS